MCWHWNAPDDMNDIGGLSSFYYKTTNYDRKTGFDIVRAMQEETPEHDFIIYEIDLVGSALKMFDSGHSGHLETAPRSRRNWFWWGNRCSRGSAGSRERRSLQEAVVHDIRPADELSQAPQPHLGVERSGSVHGGQPEHLRYRRRGYLRRNTEPRFAA